MTSGKKQRIVNVASVPHRSPFRYPGGKTWLVPYVRTWLRSLSFKPALFVEPFVGGGIIGLTVGFESLSDRVLMVELDENVAAVWMVLFSDDAGVLAERVRRFEMTEDRLRKELESPTDSVLQHAFCTILRNRVSHGGIMAHGSGFVRNGENGKGLRSRWYPETLFRRMMDIAGIRERFDFFHADGISFMGKYIDCSDMVFFIDPPYTVGGVGKRAGKRLYQHHELDHNHLFDVVAEIRGDFLMTYDNDPEVREMAERRGFSVRPVRMKNTHHAEMTELLIGKNLEWVDSVFPVFGKTLFS